MIVAEKILGSAFTLFMKYGIKSVSMDDLARNLGISKKTIYSIVDNKKDLIEKVVKEFIKQEEKDITAIVKKSTDSIDEMLSIGKHIVSFLREMKPSFVFDLQKYHPAIWTIVETEHYSFIERVIKANILKGQKAKLYRSELNVDIISKLYMVQAKALVNEDIFPNQIYIKTELLEEFFIYHLIGISSDKGRNHLNTKISIS